MIEFNDDHFLCYATINGVDNVLCHTEVWFDVKEGKELYLQPIWEKLPYDSWVKASDATNIVKVSIQRVESDSE